ncbi:MAG TPA: non-homologous end-joining DNA ligase [Nitrospirales bacterium]
MARTSSSASSSQLPKELRIDGRTIPISNPDKVLYPAGFTKLQVIDYYVRVAKFLLPHLHDRPVTLKRYPNGVTGGFFYEKRAPRFTPDWVKTFPVPRRDGGAPIKYILINDAPTLAWAANLANLEIHPFLHRVPEIHSPTAIVFDLDPGERSDVLTCAEVALLLKDLFARLDLQSFVKVSGSKGLQLYVPLNSSVTYEVTEAFAHTVAQLMENTHPKLVVAEMAKHKRAGKIFIDWSQNSEYKTTVSVYSLRAKDDRPYVSMPVTWEELKTALLKKDAQRLYFEPEAALKRLDKMGDLFSPVLTLKQKVPSSVSRTIKGNSTPSAAPALQAYREKRDFLKTPEPRPVVPRKNAQGHRRPFVVQKHAASRLHYDFRLEMQGVLKSWAVPKGLPLARGEKRLAVATEDHPVDYLKFEGTIPQGQYGGGTVMVWDIGTYQVLDGDYDKGKLKIALDGQKLKGEWTLVRAAGQEEKNWLIIKTGAALPALPISQNDSSALTQRTMEQIAKNNMATWQSNRPPRDSSPRRTKTTSEFPDIPKLDWTALPKAEIGFVDPMQCAPAADLPKGSAWEYEIKLDGYRALALKTAMGVDLLSRRNNSLNKRFPDIAKALAALPNDTIIDGEVVALDQDGKGSFSLLQNDPSHAKRIVFYAFDCLAYQDRSLIAVPLEQRRAVLQAALKGIKDPVGFSETLDAKPARLIAVAKEHGLEGLIAKRIDSVYEPGQRSGAWQKYKLNQGQELVIGGYTPHKHDFDALLVGYYDEGKLLFVGKIRNGFVPHLRAQVFQRFKGLESPVCPFANLPEPKTARRGIALTADAMKECRWLKPKLVAQVEFTEWTENNHLRHAKFVGLRDDKDAREVTREAV